MTLTPEQAKEIIENIPTVDPVFAERGKYKNVDHVDKTYRYKLSNQPLRHIAIARQATNEGVKVYVNEYSANNSIFSKDRVKAVDVLEKYTKGHTGKNGNPGIASSVGRLPSLDPKRNDVLRLSVSTAESFQQLLSWYLDLNSSNSAVPNKSQEQDSASSTKIQRSSVLPESTIPKLEQDNLDFDTKSLATDEREAVVKVRYGQGSFRDALIAIEGEKCWMTGLEGKQLLIASHIKPWSRCDSDTDSRGQLDNGLLLSALWDSAFDTGLISFDKNWSVISSSKLSESAKLILDIQKHSELPVRFRNAKRASFLDYHRQNIFQG